MHSAPGTRKWQQYGLALVTFIATSLLNLWLHRWIGYEAISLVYLLAIVILALFVGRGPTLMAAAMTALGWDFLFVPPTFSLHITRFYDQMMFVTYFMVAFIVIQAVEYRQRLRDSETNAKLLRESERLGRTLLNSVSHELRTPIAAIVSAASSLRTAGELNPMQQNLSTEIEAAATRLNRVVQSLLSAARLQSGQLQLKLDWCDVSELVRTTLTELGETLAGHPVKSDILKGLPLVRADFILTEQALSNLLVNAAVHTPAGTPIEIRARFEGPLLVLEVLDRGPGLAPDQIDRPFELFQRGATAKPGGTGLGLAIVKGFVEAQGGSVRAGNRLGGGAVFCICLPAAERPNLQEE